MLNFSKKKKTRISAGLKNQSSRQIPFSLAMATNFCHAASFSSGVLVSSGIPSGKSVFSIFSASQIYSSIKLGFCHCFRVWHYWFFHCCPPLVLLRDSLKRTSARKVRFLLVLINLLHLSYYLYKILDFSAVLG